MTTVVSGITWRSIGRRKRAQQRQTDLQIVLVPTEDTETRTLHDAGVPFLLGSDAPQLWNVPGFSSHRELAALVDAGLTPYQSLRTGTVNVATFLGEPGRSGVVRQGARADLILLEANPLQDISNSLRINGVVVNGRWIGPAERERMLNGLMTP